MKNIGFLSFGHWTPSSQSQTRSAPGALLQSIDVAVAAEELGADGAYFRVRHFARQLASPFTCGAGSRVVLSGSQKPVSVVLRFLSRVRAYHRPCIFQHPYLRGVRA